MTDALEFDKFWVDKNAYADAERQYYENLAKLPNSTELMSRGNSADDSSPRSSEDHQSPKNFVAIEKKSISESDNNKENLSTASSETPKSNIKKIKSQKCILSKDESEWITVCSKSELKEKSSKRNKKSKDRTREMTPTSVSNKDVSPPTSPKEGTTVVVAQTQPPAAQPQPIVAQQQPTVAQQQPAVAQQQPAVTQQQPTVAQQQPMVAQTPPPPVAQLTEASAKSPKKKDAKEKANKAEKKRANKKEKADNIKDEKALVIESVEEAPQVVKKESDKQGGSSQQIVSGQCSLSHEIAKARQHIKNSLECMDSAMASVPSVEVVNRLNALEGAMNDLRNLVLRVQSDVNTLMKHIPAPGKQEVAVCPPKPAAVKPAAPAPSKEDSDDGVDLFASDSEDDDAATKIREERLAAYAAKKSKKPVLIAKSNIILDVKPWDDETNMEEMEKLVRTIETDGLLWGASKLVLLAYGIKKLQISCVVEDDKVSVDWLQEEIEKFEDLVQSVDIAAFNKV